MRPEKRLLVRSIKENVNISLKTLLVPTIEDGRREGSVVTLTGQCSDDGKTCYWGRQCLVATRN